MSNHCPSQDWDTYIDQQDRAEISRWIGELTEIAVHCLPSIITNNPKLATEDAAQMAFEHAAAIHLVMHNLEAAANCTGWPGRWENAFWNRYWK
jgi:hypothetical protein